MFEAIVFAVADLGFVARCAREEYDAGEVRLSADGGGAEADGCRSPGGGCRTGSRG